MWSDSECCQSRNLGAREGANDSWKGRAPGPPVGQEPNPPARGRLRTVPEDEREKTVPQAVTDFRALAPQSVLPAS
jgi:hypothetical protein